MATTPVSPTDTLDTPGQSGRSAPSLRLAEAAKAAGVGRSTIRRHLDAGRLPGSFREDGPEGPGTGPWRVLVPELLAVGVRLKAPPDSPPLSPGLSAGQPAGQGVSGEVESLRADLRVERARREAAEQVAEAERRRADSLEVALRMLNAGEPASREPVAAPAPEPPAAAHVPDVPDPADSPDSPASPPQAEERRGWWRRFTGT